VIYYLIVYYETCRGASDGVFSDEPARRGSGKRDSDGCMKFIE
jgi:hypothetical protein